MLFAAIIVCIVLLGLVLIVATHQFFEDDEPLSGLVALICAGVIAVFAVVLNEQYVVERVAPAVRVLTPERPAP